MATAVAGATEDVPQAGLGYLLFDNNLKLVNQGWANVSSQAKVPQDAGALDAHPFERLALDEIVVNQTGFVYFFVASYEARNISVFLDDLEVKHQTTDVVLATDYYPHGQEMDGRTLQQASYRYGFQGAFAEQDEETGLASFHLRQYDSRIGRWTTPDPYNQYWSPYVGMGNAPNIVYDPTGGWGYGTSLLITAGAAAAGYGIDRAFGGDGSTGLAIGLFAGAAVGHAGLGEDWTINLPEINWSGMGKAGKLAARYVPPITTLARNLNVLPDMRLPTSEIRSVPEPRARPQLVNPTGQGIRNDAGGQGHFGAPRGDRDHLGIDLAADTGQDVVSPISGRAINSSFVNNQRVTIPTIVSSQSKLITKRLPTSRIICSTSWMSLSRV